MLAALSSRAKPQPSNVPLSAAHHYVLFKDVGIQCCSELLLTCWQTWCSLPVHVSKVDCLHLYFSATEGMQFAGVMDAMRAQSAQGGVLACSCWADSQPEAAGQVMKFLCTCSRLGGIY